MPHRTPAEFWRGVPKKGKVPTQTTVGSHSDDGHESQEPGLRLLVQGKSEKSLWEVAWRRAKQEAGWESLSERGFGNLGDEDQVLLVAKEAQTLADQAQRTQKTLPGSERTYREVYDKVVYWATKFQVVGDIITQADPLYSTLPWAIIRTAITVAEGESDTYHSMLDGVELVAQFLVQYRVIEQTYAQVDSKISEALRGTLVAFYVVILKFQICAIKYFDSNGKWARALKGLNPVSAEQYQKQQDEVKEAKIRVDADIALVHADVTKHGIDELIEGMQETVVGQTEQLKQLSATRNDILALSQDTKVQFEQADDQQQQRSNAIKELWKGDMEILQSKHENEELRDIRQWLSNAEPDTDRADAMSKRRLSLGHWLPNDTKYRNWETSTDSKILWLYGFAGTGKTSLVCRVLGRLEKECKDEQSRRMAYFFCSNDKAGTGRDQTFSRSNPEEALRSVVSQLCTSQESGTTSMLHNRYDELGPHSDKRRKLSYSDCADIIIDISKKKIVTVVWDAFDELDQDKSPVLLRCLQDVVRRAPKNVKFFISTRSFPAMEAELVPKQSIEVTADNNRHDVRTFIEQTLQTRIEDGALLNGNVPADLRKHIEDVLTSRASNMFLYASLLLEQICNRNRNDDVDSIRRKLEQLPRNLTEVYNNIMDEIHNKDNSRRSRHIAQDTFKLLLCFQKALSYEAILEAVSPPESRADVDEVKRACRTLVVRETGTETGTLEFAHYSVREHIRELENYSRSKCHLAATRCCLRALNTYVGRQGSQRKISDAQNSLRQYALLYWPFHYENIEQTDMNEQRAEVNAMLRSFLLQTRDTKDKYEIYADWLAQASEHIKDLGENMYLTSKLDALHASPPTPLFAACVFGLEDIIGKFGREQNGLNKSNAHGQNALCLAIEHNKLEVVKALLSKRYPADLNLLNLKAIQQFVDFNEPDPPKPILFASALQCAAAMGRLEITSCLIDGGAHVDLVAGYFGSALQAAALNGHESIVSLLLSRGAEPNSQGGYHGNALQAAAAEGHSHIINLLLENKPPALVNTPGGHYGSAIMAAICVGCTDTVKAILDEDGVDPNMRSRMYGKPLERAASMGKTHREIVSHLLASGAEADLASKGNSLHVLHMATINDMFSLAKYCLDKNCKIDMITTEGPQYPRRFGDFPRDMTPLGFACAEGHVRMVDYLLERGAPFQESQQHSAILWVAAYQGHANVVDLLLTRFKEKHDLEAAEKFLEKRPGGHPILWAAATSQEADVVRVLLDHGAKYESNWDNATPLLATATFASPEVTDVLLEYHTESKIDVCLNQRAVNGRTALVEACEKNRQRIANRLLDAGADYTIGANEKSTPLHAAIKHRGTDTLIARMLEKASKDRDRGRFHQFLNQQNWTGRPAMMLAVTASQVELLVRIGADYASVDNDGNTILHWAAGGSFDSAIDLILTKARLKFANEPVRFKNFINQQERLQRTPLNIAAQEMHESTVRLLLQYGADYTIDDNDRSTPLHWAARKGLATATAALLERAQADLVHEPQRLMAFLNHTQRADKTALLEAVLAGQKFTFELLLQAGADCTIPSKDGVTPLHDACSKGNILMVSRMLEKACADLDHQHYTNFLNYRNHHLGRTALWDAVGGVKLEVVKMLLQAGADYTISSKDGVTPLHAASSKGSVAIVSHLLEKACADLDHDHYMNFLNYRNHHLGRTALWDAVDNVKLEVTKLLLEKGADHTIAANQGVTPLHRAAWASPAAVPVLLAHASAKGTTSSTQDFVNARNQHGATALIDAATKNRPESMQLLFDHGADYSVADVNDHTALHRAASRNHLASVRCLLETASKDKSDNGEKFSAFLNRQGKPNNASALGDAAVKGHTEIVRLLLEYEPEYECFDAQKCSPLHVAVKGDRTEMFIDLLGFARRSSGGREKLKRVLDAQDDQGKNVWAWAREKRNVEILQALKGLGMEDRMLQLTSGSLGLRPVGAK